jgi:hypothetical protein
LIKFCTRRKQQALKIITLSLQLIIKELMQNETALSVCLTDLL